MSEFLEGLGNFIVPFFKTMGTEGVAQLLDNLHAEDPKVHKTVCVSMYRPLKKHLEPLTDKTKSKADDAAVDIFIGALEKSAKKHGIDLLSIAADAGSDVKEAP